MNVALIDRHPLFLDALAAAIRGAWPKANITRATTLAESLDVVGKGVDLVLGDLESLEGLDSDSFKRLVSSADPAPVISISHHADQPSILRALNAGVSGYLPKTMSGEVICSAVAVVLAGGACFPRQFLSRLVQPVRTGAQDGTVVLSDRDREVLIHMARGSSNKVIARELGISIATVKLRVQSILRATEAKNRTEAIAVARRLGLLCRAA
jgi:DNA-binding NarL/FixJ family response regulator